MESVVNAELLTSNAFFVEKIKNEFQDKKNVGDNVVTTLDAKLQEVAYQSLGKSKGAVVVIDPSTGKIRAMVSKPCYDPNSLVEDWEKLNQNEEAIFLNRVTQGQYAPGSTFKIVTALEYMRENNDFAAYSYDCNGSIEGGSNTIHCYGGKKHGNVDLKDSLAYSCNTSFSNIGNMLDVEEFRSTTKELLFDAKLPCALPCKKSHINLGKHA